MSNCNCNCDCDCDCDCDDRISLSFTFFVFVVVFADVFFFFFLTMGDDGSTVPEIMVSHGGNEEIPSLAFGTIAYVSLQVFSGVVVAAAAAIGSVAVTVRHSV